MREVKFEDCKTGMTLKLKEDCPFRKDWRIDPKVTIQGTIEKVHRSPDKYIDIRFCNESQELLQLRGWYFYADDNELFPSDEELISLNLEYATKRKNNYY